MDYIGCIPLEYQGVEKIFGDSGISVTGEIYLDVQGFAITGNTCKHSIVASFWVRDNPTPRYNGPPVRGIFRLHTGA
jgi:hypothetical protein